MNISSKKIFILFYIIFSFCIIQDSAVCLAERNKDLSLPFYDGEELICDVYHRGLKIGKSILTFHGEKEIDGRDVYHITFSTNLYLFKDVEDIYADKETLFPFKVVRRISHVGRFPVRIREEYDQKAFKVKIKKQGKLLSREVTIQKEGPIQNAILLPYYYRTKPDITENQRLKVNLPTVNFDVVFKGEEIITTRLGEYSAYVFASIPPRFTFCLSADEKRIPLKIESLTTLGYSLVLNSIGEVAK